MLSVAPVALYSDPHRTVQDLSELERDVLVPLALSVDPLTLPNWTSLLARCGLKAGRKSVSADEVSALCERLVGARVASQRGTFGHQLGAAFALNVLTDAAHRGTLDRFEKALLAGNQLQSFAYSRRPVVHLRMAVARDDVPAFVRAYTYGLSRLVPSDHGRFLVTALGHDAAPQWLQVLDAKPRDAYLREALRVAFDKLLPCSDELLAYVGETGPSNTKLLAARLLVLAGRGQEALAVPGMSPRDAELTASFEAFWRLDVDATQRHAEAALLRVQQNKKPGLRDIEGVCHALSLLVAAGEGAPGAWEAFGRIVDLGLDNGNAHFDQYLTLSAFRSLATGRKDGFLASHNEDSWRSPLLSGLCHAWLGQTPPDKLTASLMRWGEGAKIARTFPVVARQFDALTAMLEGDGATEGTLTALYRSRPSWELALDGLEAALRPAPNDGGLAIATPQKRLVWVLRLSPSVHVEPRLVTGGKAGRGKRMSVVALIDADERWLTELDRRVLAAVKADELQRARMFRSDIVLEEEVLPALVGHPHVVGLDGAPLQLVAGQPELVAEPRDDGGTIVRVEPPELSTAAVAFREEGSRVIVYERPPEIARVVETFRGDVLTIPKAGEARLARVLAALAIKVPVRGHGRMAVRTRDVPPANNIIALLIWDKKALHVAFRVMPLGPEGPTFTPGHGDTSIASEIDGELLRTSRSHDAERAALAAVLDACPTAASLLHGNDATAVAFEVTAAYEILVELTRLREGVELAWPRGRNLPLPVERGLDDLKLRVRQGSNWLAVTATLRIDERRVVSFAELLKLRENGGKFIRLDEDRVLALSAELARRLDALQRLGKPRKDELRLHPVVLPFVADLAEGVGSVELDRAASEALERVRAAEAYRPKVPRGFSGTLRPYQHEGFVWLAKLAQAGLGACLADDMGLGKTVQALALLVARASEGPALVVAPTSVIGNWREETRRFAPTLRVHELATGNRAELIASAGPRDVILCTYGLLVGEIAVLQEKPFHTVVFDEAHALKNADTQRAAAAFAIRADFRVGLTGTPVENHLGELWSVMQASVPGLLGDATHFQEHVATAIARGDRGAAGHLRALVRPFILRRTKSQVLPELPDRTETVLWVQPRPDEAAYYEALRRRALESVQQQTSRSGGQARLQLLTEITRLRQAAIDPRLLDRDDAPAGAKIEAAIKQIERLRDEGHRVLVFTQFLGSMALLRERLRAVGIDYLELEGATPARQRTERVEAFQAGRGDVFLMSLRAGGVGVNLTGADYVIHLDPWWNPAVEDQATGRAHRIGQTRPVTVYRFVTLGTIEERILALHERKRELADDLLEGMEKSRKLSLDELRELLMR